MYTADLGIANFYGIAVTQRLVNGKVASKFDAVKFCFRQLAAMLTDINVVSADTERCLSQVANRS